MRRIQRESHSVNREDMMEAAKRSHVLYDRTGDQHYFMASALQKSIRGSDDNASLYWLTRQPSCWQLTILYICNVLGQFLREDWKVFGSTA